MKIVFLSLFHVYFQIKVLSKMVFQLIMKRFPFSLICHGFNPSFLFLPGAGAECQSSSSSSNFCFLLIPTQRFWWQRSSWQLWALRWGRRRGLQYHQQTCLLRKGHRHSLRALDSPTDNIRFHFFLSWLPTMWISVPPQNRCLTFFWFACFFPFTLTFIWN